MLELQKLVSALAMPLGASLVLAVIAFGAALVRRRRLAVFVGLVSLGWLWLWSTPAASDLLRGYIEQQVPARTVDQLPSADVIVVLGGGMGGELKPWRPYPRLNQVGDRLWHAARLYRAGKAPHIVLSGGKGVFQAYTADEASAMALVLKDFGVPASALILEKRSRTTSENASATAKILSGLGARRVLLVTSALHMARALATFRSRGIEAVPASADVAVVPRPPQFIDWVPSVRALENSTEAMHELLGMARCRVLGC